MTDEPKQLAAIDTKFDPSNLTLREISFIANEMAAAKMFPDIVSAHTAFVKILAGLAMGIDPFQAMAGIFIIQGKAVVGGGLLAAAVKNSAKYDYRVKEQTDKACTIEFYQRAGDKLEPIGVSKFTIEDARKAGTKNLEKFPRNMLFNRAMSNGVKWYVPDATNGPVYVDGEIIEAEPMKPVLETVAEARADAGMPPMNDMAYVDDFPQDEPSLDPSLDAALEAIEQDPITGPQRAKLFVVLKEKGITGAEKQKSLIQSVAKEFLGIKDLASTNDLSKEQASDLISYLVEQDGETLKLFFGEA